MALLLFFRDAFRELFRGSFLYWSWIVLLWAIIVMGGWSYIEQLGNGLVVTNMSNQVSWGFYISNFTFLVGVAAAAANLLVSPITQTIINILFSYLLEWKIPLQGRTILS